MLYKLHRKLLFVFSLTANTSLHLADLLPHLLVRARLCRGYSGHKRRLGLPASKLPRELEAGMTRPPPAPPAPPGLGAMGDRQEIYEQLELAAICRGQERGVNQGPHCVQAGRALRGLRHLRVEKLWPEPLMSQKNLPGDHELGEKFIYSKKDLLSSCWVPAV